MSRGDPLIGRKLANYRVERLLTRGGMASVYYGWDIQLERPVAIKLIDARFRDKPGYAERFLREARAVATWHHENILQVYYADNEGGLYYYVMEYIRGPDLSQLISQYKEAGELAPQEDVIRIGWACARALDYAHQKGVIHRDVKPSNLLLSEEGRVVLGDFGIAMDTTQGTIGKVFGSPQYIAPEQARNSADAVPQSDLYSLGVILYEMLTGCLPFEDPSPTSLALQHITLDPPPPRELNPALSADVEQVLLKALSKSPAERYQSGAALMSALEQALRAQPSETAPSTAQGAQVQDADLQNSGKTLSYISIADRVSDYIKAQPPMTQAFPGADVEGPRTLIDRLGPRAWWGAGCGLLLLMTALLIVLGGAVTRGRETPLRTSEQGVSALTQAAILPTELRETASSQTPLLPTTVNPTPEPSSTMTAIPPPAATTPPPPSPTHTPPPTETSPPTPTESNQPPQPTRIGSDLFVMYYDDTSFYMKNLSGKDRSVYPLAFERIADDGEFNNRFEGWRWGNIYSKFRADYCMVLEILNYTDHLEPKECNNRHLVLHYPTLTRDYIFWTDDKSSKEFRVLWNDQEAGRCKIKKGSCEVYLP